MRCADSRRFHFRHFIRPGWEIHLVCCSNSRRNDRLSPAMARRQVDRLRASRAKSSLRLQHFLRWKRLRFLARPFHCRLFPPRRPARPVFPEPEITHGQTNVGVPLLRRSCSLRKAGGESFRAAPDFTQPRLQLAGCRILRCVKGSGFDVPFDGWLTLQPHTSRQPKAPMEFAGAAFFAFFFSAKGATLAAPATLCWKLDGCALKSPTHAPAPAPASSVSAGPTSLAEAQSFALSCLPPSLLQGYNTNSPVEAQEETLRASVSPSYRQVGNPSVRYNSTALDFATARGRAHVLHVKT